MTEWEAGLVMSAPAALGFAAGVVGARFPRVPRIMLLASAVALVVGLAATTAYVAACPRCPAYNRHDSNRQVWLYIALFWSPIFMAGIYAMTLAGKGVGRLLLRLRR
jgi:energy-converting hydrogenase Eha subunit A